MNDLASFIPNHDPLLPSQGDTEDAGPWIMTASGRAYHFLTPSPAEIEIRDIAAHLARLARFNGATRGFYSVAQHSVQVADLLPMTHDGALQLYGLLHDAHEAYLGDSTTPLKKARRALAGVKPDEADPDTRLAQRCQRTIHEALGLPEPDAEEQRLVREADFLAFAIERRDLMPSPRPGVPDWDVNLPDTRGHKLIRQLAWDMAEDVFMQKWRLLEDRRRRAKAVA
jgi:hypothetical protein